MKSFKFILAALLLMSIAGVANAGSIPVSVDAKAGPEVWLTDIYNNNSADLANGDVVCWDIAGSTGDNDNYVKDCTAADTFLVAGIVYPAAIIDGDRGSIAIRGVVTVNLQSGHTVSDAGSLICASATAGKANSCSNGLDDAMAIGFTTAADSSDTAITYIFSR